MADELNALITEAFSFGSHVERDPDRIRNRGTKDLTGFVFGTLMRKSGKDGMPDGIPVEVKRGKIARHWGESPEAFADRIHLKFQEPIRRNDKNLSYTPHADNLEDYLTMRTGRPFSHTTHTDPNSGEITFYSHHLYPIYKN